MVSLTHTVKHHNEHKRLLAVEIRAALGAGMEPAGTVHVERLNGALRDRFNAITRKTHAFAKRNASLRCAGGGGRSSITTFIGLIRPCGCLLSTVLVTISSGLQPWLWN